MSQTVASITFRKGTSPECYVWWRTCWTKIFSTCAPCDCGAANLARRHHLISARILCLLHTPLGPNDMLPDARLEISSLCFRPAHRLLGDQQHSAAIRSR